MSFIRVNEEIYPIGDIAKIRATPPEDGEGVEIVLRNGTALLLPTRTVDDVWKALEHFGATTIFLRGASSHIDEPAI